MLLSYKFLYILYWVFSHISVENWMAYESKHRQPNRHDFQSTRILGVTDFQMHSLYIYAIFQQIQVNSHNI